MGKKSLRIWIWCLVLPLALVVTFSLVKLGEHAAKTHLQPRPTWQRAR
jgi:hypothetical protein